MHSCASCKTEWPRTAQYYDRNEKGKGGLHSVCKKCRKKLRLEASIKKYNPHVTRDEIEILLATGCCQICGESRRTLCVDHCHKFGTVRGLLCNKCNMGIGLFGDDPVIIEKALDYLRGGK